MATRIKQPKKRGGKRAPLIPKAELAELCRVCKSVKEVAAHTPYSRNTIQRMIDCHGLPQPSVTR